MLQFSMHGGTQQYCSTVFVWPFNDGIGLSIVWSVEASGGECSTAALSVAPCGSLRIWALDNAAALAGSHTRTTLGSRSSSRLQRLRPQRSLTTGQRDRCAG